MSLTPTRTFMNWVNVSVTPQGGNPIAIGRVTGMAPMRSAKNQAFYGDAFSFAQVMKATERERGIGITGGDVATLMLIPEDVPCVVTGTLLDPRNGLAPGGGAIKVTLYNALLAKDESRGENNRFASGTANFQAFSTPDANGNELDPLVVVAL